MKTTKKEFKSQVQEHILNGLNEDYTTEPKEQIANVVSSFKDWYGPYEQRKTPNRQEAFKSWLQGLPSDIHTEYTYHGISETLKNWYENVGAEYKERDGDKEADLYYGLVYREFNTLCKKNNVSFWN